MSTRIVLSKSGITAVQVEVDARVTRRATEAIADDMRRYVPVDTGRLRGTIRTKYAPGRGRIAFGNVSQGVDYHLYVEYGTSRMRAQPYARPAAYTRRSLA